MNRRAARCGHQTARVRNAKRVSKATSDAMRALVAERRRIQRANEGEGRPF